LIFYIDLNYKFAMTPSMGPAARDWF